MLRAGAGQGATSFLPGDGFVGLCLDDLIATGSCFTLGAELVRRRFQPMGRDYPPNYRNNDRLVFDDPALAAELWTIAAPRLPEVLTFDGVPWRAVALNSRFRACRYARGQSFTVHRDGAHAAAPRRSWLTLQIYLNDAGSFAGGHTRFYRDVRETTPHAAIEPRAGRAIVFDHRAWHDGEAVTRGTKLVLRTDVMFERVDAPASAHRDSLADEGLVGRHDGYVWRVLERRDGGLVSSGRDGAIREWTGAPERQLGRGSVTALAEDATGRLWAGTRSGWIGAIDGAADAEGVAGAAGVDAGAAVLDLAVGTRGQIAAALASGEVALLDATGAITHRVRTHDGWVWGVAALEDGAFASVAEDGCVAYTRADGQLGTPARPAAGPLRALTIAGDLRITGTATGEVLALDPSGAVRWRIQAHVGACTALAARGSLWLSGGEDARVHIWDHDRRIATRTCHDFVRSVGFTTRGDIFYAGYDGRVIARRMTR